MHNPELVEVRYTRRHLGKLCVVELEQKTSKQEIYGRRTHKAQTVGLWIRPDVFHHVSVGHPLRDDAEILGILRNGNPQQRQDIWMRQAFPNENLSTKALS